MATAAMTYPCNRIMGVLWNHCKVGGCIAKSRLLIESHTDFRHSRMVLGGRKVIARLRLNCGRASRFTSRCVRRTHGARTRGTAFMLAVSTAIMT